VLAKVKDVVTARNFLKIVERFKERVAGAARAEGNPLPAATIPGLYNIALKSVARR
jgi:hypothetical protein